MPAKRRRRRDPAKETLWRATIRHHQESGLSVRDFCEREGLKDGNFLRWRRELDRRDREKTLEQPKLATKEPTELRVSPVFLPVQVVDADLFPARPTPPIEIVLDGGPTVRVPTGFDPRTLGDILAVLGGPPMLSWPPTVRIFLCTDATDMRKGFDSLAHLVESSLTLDPMSGHLFVFRSRRGDRIKVLYWDRDGLALWYKRLEKGSFRFPAATTTDRSKGVEVKAADLMMILDGVDLGSVRRQRRYERQPA